MPRLIDADALQFKEMDIGYYMRPPMVVLKCDVDAAPTVDAVPVVRCRDCKHSEPIPPKARNAFYPDRVLVCKSWRGDYDVTHDISVTWKDGYCDEGERKEPADGRTD